MTNTAGSHTITVEKGGDLTLTGTGTVDNVSHGRAALYNDGTVTVDGVTLTRSAESEASTPSDSKGNSWYVVRNDGTLTVKSGKVISQGNFSSLMDNCRSLTIENGTFQNGMIVVKNEETGTLTINGGSFTATYYSEANNAVSAVQNWGQAEITEGTFTSAGVAVYASEWDRDSSLTISGGEFTGQNNVGIYVASDDTQTGKDDNKVTVDISNAKVNGGISVVDVDQAAEQELIVNITSGTINGDLKTSDGGQAAISVTGGTFDQTVDSKYLPSGMDAVDNGSGQFVIEPKADAQAQIGTAVYATLDEAVKNAKTGDTVELRRDVEDGTGIIVSGEGNREFTIDFKDHTYTVSQAPMAGSAGTKSQCFQLLKGSTLTMKNGTIVGNYYETDETTGKTSAVKMIIQNYCNLTLEDMTLDATKGENAIQYVLSNNCGDTTVTGDTQIIAKEGQVAFDVWYGMASTYDEGVTITFDDKFNGKVEGAVEYGSAGRASSTSGWQEKAKLTIQGGEFNCEFRPSTSGVDELKAEDGIKVSGGSFKESMKLFVVDGLNAELEKNGVEVPFSYYATVEEALAAASENDKVTPLSSGSISLASFGFKAKGADANSAISEIMKKLGAPDGTFPNDCQDNTMWTIILGTGTDTEYTFTVTKEDSSVTNTINTTEASIKNGGAVYFSFDRKDHVGDKKLEAGEYKVEVSAKADPYNVLDSRALTLVDAEFYDSDELVETQITASGDEVSMPQLSKSNYRLTWQSGEATYQPGEKVAIDSHTTFAAVWTKRSSGSSSAARNDIVVGSASHGKITVSPTRAGKDETVTITVKPDQGYLLDQLTVTDANGKTIKLTKVDDNKYTFTMPNSKVDIKATFVLDASQHDCPSEKFADVDQSKWYHEGIDYAVSKGLMNGTGASAFSPNAATTRGMVVTILYQLEGQPEAAASTFADVPAGQWYSKAIGWASANGIVSGYSADRFGPEDPITREQMAVILHHYAIKKGYDVSVGESTNILSYTDASRISEYAIPAMQWAKGAGVINGTSASTLSPAENATRAQAATILMHFCEKVAK